MIGTICDTIEVGILIFTHTSYTRSNTHKRHAVEQWGDGPTQSEGATSKGGNGPDEGGNGRRAEQRGDGPESSGAKSREQWGEVPSMRRAPEGPRSITPGSRPGSCPAV